MNKHAPTQWKLTYAIIALVLASAGLLFAYRVFHATPSGAPSSDGIANKDIAPAPKRASPLVNAGHSGHFSRSNSPAFGSGVANDPKVGSEQSNAESTVEAREIIARLTHIDLNSGALTSEQAKVLKESFTQLASHGTAAIPAVREFLERNQDIDF